MAAMVLRFGRLESAAILSLIWALPMAAWAGSVDLAPGPLPWVAFGIGAALLVVWIQLLRVIEDLPQEERSGRFRIRQMSAPERRWNAVVAASLILLIGWLNAAATVDWGILAPRVRSGEPGPVLLLAGLLLVVIASMAAAALGWTRATHCWRQRPDGALTAG